MATYVFGDCELDTRRLELRRAGEPRHVEPQVFDVLRHLLEQRDRLVTKEELLDGIWGHRFVTPSTLSSRIKAARQAIGDDGSAQKIIRTVRGRGFRFLAEVRVREEGGDAREPRRTATTVRIGVASPESEVAAAEPPGTAAELVGRDAELARLDALLSEAAAGTRRLACLGGEPGIGKSVLVDAVVARARAAGGVRIGRGQCLDRRGPGEPYLPILDAFGRMGREPGGEAVVGVLEACAPTWLAQLPGLLGPGRLAEARRGAFGATRERMLREMVEAIELLTRDTPLLLVLEDLHWSDPSTLDLLGWIGQRSEPARLFVLATYRPDDSDFELSALLATLRRAGRLEEIPLTRWGDSDLRHYVEERFPGPSLPEPLVELLAARAEGNPLFVRMLLDAWLESGALDGAWRGELDAPALAELAGGVPSTLRVLIEQRINRLAADDQRVLETASVVGVEFGTAVVAAAESADLEEVEERLLALSRRGQMVQEAGAWDSPAGPASARFRFGHHLFREVLYERIPHARRVRLHRTIGLYIEACYGEAAAEAAGELALHFRAGREDERAVRYLDLAARRALERSAQRESIGHVSAALEILRRRAELPDAPRWELGLQRMLAPALLVTRGWGDPDAERAYARARELAERLDDSAELARTLYGLAYLHEIRGDYLRSEALVEERLGLALAEPGPGFIIESHELLSCSRFHQGHFEQALENANRALDVFDDSLHDRFFASLGENAAVGCHYWAGLALWFLGRPDSAVRPVETALTLAEGSQLIYMQAASEWHMARLRMLRREIPLAAEHAERARAIAERQGYPYPHALALALAGRIRVDQQETRTGLELLRKGLALQAEMGADMERPYCLGLLAEALLAAGQVADCLAATDEALDIIARRSRAFFWEAELHRVRGAALVAEREADAAEAALRTALATAARQHALSLELRAAMDLYRLQRGRADGDALELLRGTYAKFTEGHDTADLREARSLLGTPGGQPQE